MIFGGIEAGGTKFVCAVARQDGELLDQTSFPTRGPQETLGEAVDYFRAQETRFGSLGGLGVASFGPLDLDRSSAHFGAIQKTPKPGWSGVNLREFFQTALNCPVAIDTDVNGAGLAEGERGAGRGLSNFVYLTIGTGIGGGLILAGRPLSGLTHPEMGHVRLRRHPEDGGFSGCCPFHGDCAEGLASGAAIIARTGKSLSQHDSDAPIRRIIADYIAQLCAAIIVIASPQRIILGGGVMKSVDLLPMIRERLALQLAGYVQHEALGSADYLALPELGPLAGVTGALIMAGR